MQETHWEFAEGSHLAKVRGLDQVPPGTTFKPGRFGRMFPNLPPFKPDDDALISLGKAMVDPDPGGPAGNNGAIPAGFTYLGQFIDHDITFDTTSLSEQPRDPQAIFNFRTPQLELDSVYGAGPAGSPHLYERKNKAKFVIGLTSPLPGLGDPALPVSMPHDLPRIAGTGFAAIDDPRNDENLIVAQTHLAFLYFHNMVVDREGVSFDEARRLVRWHYQWIVLHDFLDRLTDPAVFADVLTNGRKFFHFDGEPFIPVEFAAAAFRCGHPMVREAYNYNRVFKFDGGVPATLRRLFTFSGRSGDGKTVPIPSDWIIDWRRFHKVTGSADAIGLSRKIGPLLAPTLQEVPGVGSLASANLRRGAARGLPSGQAVAAAMGITPLPPGAFGGVAPHPDSVARDHGFDLETPLWYYILKEAELAGGRLGEVGSRIVCEVFLGLLEGDPESFLTQSPGWTPTLGPTPGTFTMADLLEYMDHINPIGGSP